MSTAFWNRIAQSKILSKAFQDPVFMSAIKEMESNPQYVFETISKTRPDYLDALKEFSAILGDQLTKYADELDGEKQNTNQASTAVIPDDLPDHEKKLLDRVFNDPKLQDILRDPKMQSILSRIRDHPDDSHHIIKTASPDVSEKLGRLIECGLLQYQPETDKQSRSKPRIKA
eukprot:jgi/Hompol1/6326/HPOL_002248-RA